MIKSALKTITLTLISIKTFAAPLVLETDFGLQDGAVSAMKGVIYLVDPNQHVSDLTHYITPHNTWEAAYRLYQTTQYWPKGTVFVIVVDPGVGTARKSIVAESNTGHYFVTPDNGTLTLIAKHQGIKNVRIIDEKVNRLPGSERSHTFHGRDVYAYTGARLASGKISFEQVGPEYKQDLVFHRLVEAKSQPVENGAPKVISGSIPVLDVRFGNVWTNIPAKLMDKNKIELNKEYHVKIFNKNELVYNKTIPYLKSFGGVPKGGELLYLNSLENLSIAVNQGSFAKRYSIKTGPDWRVEIEA